jgi:hypothetical protein
MAGRNTSGDAGTAAKGETASNGTSRDGNAGKGPAGLADPWIG